MGRRVPPLPARAGGAGQTPSPPAEPGGPDSRTTTVELAARQGAIPRLISNSSSTTRNGSWKPFVGASLNQSKSSVRPTRRSFSTCASKKGLWVPWPRRCPPTARKNRYRSALSWRPNLNPAPSPWARCREYLPRLSRDWAAPRADWARARPPLSESQNRRSFETDA